MSKHLDRAHQIHPAEGDQPEITLASMAGTKIIPAGRMDPLMQKNCDILLTKLIACNNIPTCIVELRGFAKFCEKLNPQFVLPCRKTVTTSITKMATNLKLKMIEVLHDQQYVSLVVDFWSINRHCFLFHQI